MENRPEDLISPWVGAGRTGAYIEAAALSAREHKRQTVLRRSDRALFLACRLYDMTGIMMALFDEPETVHILLEKQRNSCVVCKAFREAGADG